MGTHNPKSSFDLDLILMFCIIIIIILFYPQSAFYLQCAVCSLHFTLTGFKMGLDTCCDLTFSQRSALYIYNYVKEIPLVPDIYSCVY